MTMFGPDQFQDASRLPEIMGKTHLGAPTEVYFTMLHGDKTFQQAVQQYDDMSDIEFGPDQFDIASEEGAIEKAAYQKKIASQNTPSIMAQNPGMSEMDAEDEALANTAGMSTPWGSGLMPFDVLDILKELPGLGFLGNVNSDETTETMDDAAAFVNAHNAKLAEAEEVIQATAEEGGTSFWDGVTNFAKSLFVDDDIEQKYAGFTGPIGIGSTSDAQGSLLDSGLDMLHDTFDNIVDNLTDQLELTTLIPKLSSQALFGAGISADTMKEYDTFQNTIYEREQNKTLDAMLQADGLDMMVAQISDPSLYKGEGAPLTEEDIEAWLLTLSDNEDANPDMVEELQTAFSQAKIALRTPVTFGPEQFQQAAPPMPPQVPTPPPPPPSGPVGLGAGLNPQPLFFGLGGDESGTDMGSMAAMTGPMGGQGQGGPLDMASVFTPGAGPTSTPTSTVPSDLFTGDGDGETMFPPATGDDGITIPPPDTGDDGITIPPPDTGEDEAAADTFGKGWMSAIGKSNANVFSNIFNAIPGSQAYDAQRAMPGLFNQTEALYHLYNPHRTVMTNFGEDVNVTGINEQMQMNIQAGNPIYTGLTDAEGNPFGEGAPLFAAEAASFENWAEKHMSTEYSAQRYGNEFYKNVMNLATRQSAMADTTPSQYSDEAWLSGLKDEMGGAEGAFGKMDINDLLVEMDRFMAPTKGAKSHLVNLVTMFNMPSGADAYTRNLLYDSYGDMYDAWLLADKSTADYLGAFTSLK